MLITETAQSRKSTRTKNTPSSILIFLCIRVIIYIPNENAVLVTSAMDPEFPDGIIWNAKGHDRSTTSHQVQGFIDGLLDPTGEIAVV